MQMIRVTGYIETSEANSRVDYEFDIDKAEWDRKDARTRHAMIIQNLVNDGHLVHSYSTAVHYQQVQSMIRLVHPSAIIFHAQQKLLTTRSMSQVFQELLVHRMLASYHFA